MPKRSRLKRGSSKARATRMKVVRSLTPTEARIDAMLKENTGIHMMDSGGAYGRSWQQNQGKDFTKQPTISVDGYKDGSFELTQNVFPFLVNHLKVDANSEKLNKRFKAFSEKKTENPSHLADMEEFMNEELFPGQNTLVDICGNEDGQITKAVNTYNEDNILSQTLQFIAFRYEGQDYMLLQIHGGADVRGGYTEPQVFSIETDGGEGFVDIVADLHDINASDGVNSWFSDDVGYHWYDDNSNEVSTSKWKWNPAKKQVINTANGKPIKFSTRYG